MKNDVKMIMDSLYECVDYMREVVNEAERFYIIGAINEKEYNDRVKWFWYQTFNRLMDESFSRNMPASGWRNKEE